MSFPSASHVLPKNRDHLPKADLRRPITAWKAMIWAYADEHVRAASNVGPDRYADVGYASCAMDKERVSGGLINGVLDAHEDALLIDAKLRDWFKGQARRYLRVVHAAERRGTVAREIVVVRARLVPVYDRDGQIAMLREKRGGKYQAVACLVECEGEPHDVCDARLAEYAEFVTLLDAFLGVMAGFPLSKWKITP